MVEDEAQGEVRERAARGHEGAQAVDARQRLAQVLGREVQVPPIAFRPAVVEGHGPREAALVEGDAGDESHLEALAGREEHVLRRLVEDVVDDLHAVDQPRVEGGQHVRGLPAVHADPEPLDEPLALEVPDRPLPAVVRHPGVAPDVELLEVDALQAQVAPALVRHLDDVVVREDLGDGRLRLARPAAVLGRDLRRGVELGAAMPRQGVAEEPLAPALAIGVGGVEEVAAPLDRAVQGPPRLLVVGAGPSGHAPHPVADLGDLPAQTSERSEAHGRHHSGGGGRSGRGPQRARAGAGDAHTKLAASSVLPDPL